MAIQLAFAAARLLLTVVRAATVKRMLTSEQTKQQAAVELRQGITQSLLKAGVMPGVQVKVIGAPEVADMLRKLNVQTTKRVVRSALRQGAVIVEKQIERRTYNHSTRKERTGLMGSSPRVTTKLKKGGDEVVAMVAAGPRKGAPYYWWFLERGTGSRTTRSRRGSAARGRVTPRPWVAPALSQTSSEVLAKITSSIKRGVEREMSKLQKTGG